MEKGATSRPKVMFLLSLALFVLLAVAHADSETNQNSDVASCYASLSGAYHLAEIQQIGIPLIARFGELNSILRRLHRHHHWRHI
jgi:hypothetical protein